MKLCIYILLLVIAAFGNAKSFDFGKFFDHAPPSDSSSKVATDSFLDTERSDESNTSSASSVYKEFDSSFFDSSASESIEDRELLNSTSGSNETVDQIDSVNNDSTTKQDISTSSPNKESHQSESTSTSSTSDPAGKSTNVFVTMATNDSESVATLEEEEVVLGTVQVTTALIPKTIIQKSIEWVEDAYTLSILMPIAAGVLFALSIIVTIACCRCLRRCCRRRRFKRKVLPDSIKNLTSSDRARLLGDTSDEEF